jgi:hypothetical protein
MVMREKFVPCLVSLAAAACAAGMPKPIDPRSGHGYDGCADFKAYASKRASRSSALGWTFLISGAGATAAGATVLPLDGTLSRREKLVAGSLVAGGVLLLTAAQAFFKRSDAASTFAGEAASVAGERDGGKPIADDLMAAKCNAALGAWERSRTDSSAVAAALLQDQKTATAKDAGSSAAHVDLEKARLDFKLNALKASPALSVEQLDQLVAPPIEPPPADKAQPPGNKPPAPQH